MKNLKKLIIIVSIIIIIIIALIIILFNQAKSPKHEVNEILSEGDAYELTQELQIVTIRNNAYIVKNCIEKFYITYANIFTSTNSDYMLEGAALEYAEKEQKANIKAVYNMLDEEYITYANITEENLKSKLEQIEQVNVEINKMYISEQTDNISVYFVYGNLIEVSTAINEEFSMIIKVDMQNETFKILLQDYINEKYPNVKVGDSIQITVGDKIKNDTDNIFEYSIISDEEYITDIFNEYKKDILYNKTRAYQLLNSEYSKKRFDSQQDFEEYIKNNISKFGISKLDKYQKTKMDDYNQYVCIDQNNNYYVFRETSPMQYTVILDTYTIDLPEFVAKYEKAGDEEKVLLNIQKCFEAINNQDYEYVYNRLDQTYRNNNFATLSDFENYIKSNFFEKNQITVQNAEKQEDIYLYTINITDSSGKSSDSINKTFVMQLKEGTDFVMSFSV